MPPLAGCVAARSPGLRVAVGDEVPLCTHRVPEASCVRCHPDFIAGFQKQGDWCDPHRVPESQCLECHPGMTFTALPPLPTSADLRVVSPMGEDLPDLGVHLARGRPTAIVFFAAWCVACRDLDIDLHSRLSSGADLAVRKANVMSWESPLGQRYLGGASTLPYVLVFDRSGRQVGEMAGYDASRLDRLIVEAAR